MKTLFGAVRQCNVVLNAYGRVAACKLREIPNHVNVAIDSSIVMPNHVHAIVFLDPVRFHESRLAAGGPWPAPTGLDRKLSTISSVVGLYKQAVTRAIRQLAENAELLVWQRGFYDHIIRDEDDLLTRRQYMLDNPQRWNHENKATTIEYK